MSIESYPDDQAKRFEELAELFLLCRAAWREITAETEGHPNPSSVAASDLQETTEQIAPSPGSIGVVGL